MSRKQRKSRPDQIPPEIGTIRKNWTGRLRVALVYPNTYDVGMANLGFHTVYHLLNAMATVVCERVFLPDQRNTRDRFGPLRSVESGRRLGEFDVIAFSISFEQDFAAIPYLLNISDLPPLASRRELHHPLVLAGGVVCFLNPEPIAPFIDLVLIGEAETLLPQFIPRFDPLENRSQMLLKLAREITGAYVPALFRPQYKITPDGNARLTGLHPLVDIPATVQCTRMLDLSQIPAHSAIVCPQTSFARAYLIEVARGCPHGCRFCSAGYIYRPPRFRSLPLLEAAMREGMAATNHIGLVGTAVSDLPYLRELCSLGLENSEVRISFSSLRADNLSPEVIDTLHRSHVKTAAIAPDAGSERMRQVINKGISETQILAATRALVTGGISNIKLYFMVGLPFETMQDIDAVVTLTQKVKTQFLAASRPKGRIGNLTVSINPFVPKPFTPFQWAEMDRVPLLRKKIQHIKNGLRHTANVKVHAESPRRAYRQAILARGDRRMASLLLQPLTSNDNWSHILKQTPFDPEFFACRERSLQEWLPWDFIDHGIRKTYLAREYQRAREARPTPPCPEDRTRCDRCGVCVSVIRE